MKVIDGQRYLTIGEVARKIGRIPQTLKNWITWYETQSEETKLESPLPPVITLDEKGTRYFKEEDVAVFEKFKELIKYGGMSEFSITRWGKKGKEIQQRKEERIAHEN